MRVRIPWSRFLLPVVPLVLAGAIAELAVRLGWVPAYLVPAPSRVARAFATESDLWRATWETAIASLAGFGLSAGAGLLIAIVLSSSRWIERTFYALCGAGGDGNGER